ncbi:DUF4097 family beta strand repeat-containing protein [Actinomadura oligospora]|uniref:DUF4097 family beta strand repeat-containing protein n=1 Tax=Actinomadura oligospora TaxID=111804 RepID=UPI0004BC183B|nr:DUF4097 family beta strand repeat-containing protein [Actinomadura oligospora]
MTTRNTVTAPQNGPVLLSVDLPHGLIRVHTEPGRTVAEVTVSTDDPALAEAVRDTVLTWNPERDELIVRVPEVSGAHSTVVSHDGKIRVTQNSGNVPRGATVTGVTINDGVINVGDGNVTVDGMTIVGNAVVGGTVGTVTVTAYLPEQSALVSCTRSADLDAAGTYEGVKATSTSGGVTVENARYLITNTASGRIRAEVAEHAQVNSRSGGIRIGHTADVSARTKSGAITVGDYAAYGTGGTAYLEAASGDISLTASGPGEVTARSATGSVGIDAGPHLNPATLTVRASSRTGRVHIPGGAR